MSVHHRQPTIGRLMIPPNLGFQQPSQAAMFSPSLPPAIQHVFNPPFVGPVPGNVMTPMQTNFMPTLPTGGRPINHRARASIAQLAAAGIPPPIGIPLTPLLPGPFPQGLPPMLMQTPHFQPRSRRAPSVSTGGPPKAVLGGPGAKNRVITDTAPTPTITAPPQKTKKAAVNIPRETIPAKGDGDTRSNEEPTRREIWARVPLRPSEVPEVVDTIPPETFSVELFPLEAEIWRNKVPPTVDVFLPGKIAWNEYKKRIIDEKLARLGIDEVFEGGVNVANTLHHIHAPHARAASISSPADPALLMFKLNKLQQSQNPTATNPMSASPQSAVDHTPSPGQGHNIPSHGHSVVPDPPAMPPYNPSAAFNPFGPQATLGSDQIFPRNTNVDHPPSKSPNLTGGLGSRPLSRPDFTRGFGLDIPEEEEPPEDADNEQGTDQGSDMDLVEAEAEGGVETEDEGVEMLNRIHSRHVSRLSAVLSLRSVGRQQDPLPDAGSPAMNLMFGDLDLTEKEADGVTEWTGSEDPKGDSDEESTGEWSNPSDEERARQGRRQRRMTRRQGALQDVPRKLPNFPRPPPTSFIPPSNQREDDVFSNPSDEEKIEETVYPQLPPSGSTGYGRSLPPLPHSRTTSAQFSYYDPAAHSRTASEQVTPYPSYPSIPAEMVAPLSTGLRPVSLNPFAKPFSFGTKSTLTLPSWQQPDTGVSLVVPSSQTISSRPLNAAASEFKPYFTFEPPAAAPHLSFNSESPDPSNAGRPLPTPPAHDANGREQQGREKRQRRSSEDDEGGTNNMSSFKFPSTSSGDFGKGNHWSAPPTPAAFDVERRASVSAPPPQPFTVSGFVSDVPLHDSPDTEVAPREEQSPYGNRALPVPPRQKRAPLPLDFTHPVSKNTVPAGLFKALANGGADTSRRVRSRLPSRDVFDLSPQSLDDNHMPTISRTISRPRLVTDPVNSANRDEPLDSSTPPPHRRRRSSLPASHGATRSSLSDFLGPSLTTLGYTDLQQFEQRLDSLLDDKLDDLRRELMQQQNSSSLNETTETMLAEIISLRGQLQESTSRTLESQKGFNYQWLQGAVQQANHDTKSSLQRDLSEIMRRVDAQSQNNLDLQKELTPFINEVTSRTMKTVVSISQQYASHLESLVDSGTIVNEILNALNPHLASMRPVPIDYDVLTSQLSQAVKPNISQLIDLASDKRETAGLILDQLLPALQALAPVTSEINIDNLTSKVVAEVRKVVNLFDAHEIKEQVSDLVAERLSTQLADQYRERTEGVVERIQESVANGLGPVPGEISSILGKLATIHRDVSELNPEDLASLQHGVASIIADLPPKLGAATESLNAALIDIKLQRETQSKWEDVASKVDRTESTLHSLSDSQKIVSSQNLEILSTQKDAIAQVSAFSFALEETTKALKVSQEELITRAQLSLRESDEYRELLATNSELQAQLVKACASHGQVLVEKDALSGKFKAAEEERDMLKTEVGKLSSLLSTKSFEAVAAAVGAKNAELEEAQTQALVHQQATDATMQKLEARIAEYEKEASQFSSIKESLQTKVHELELHVAVTTRDKVAAEQTTAAIREERDRLLFQQDDWEELHRAAKQIQLLTSQVKEADIEELRHLRDYHDRTRPLEGEYNNLQRRFKDQESKIASLERTMSTVRQTLAQAQQRAVEWEKREKETDTEIGSIRSQLEEANGVRTLLDSEVSLLKTQLQEKEADGRLTQDRESKLRDQVAALEEQIACLKAEASKPSIFTPAAITPTTKGYNFEQPARSESRASTVYLHSRSATPVGTRPARAQLIANGVWNSMHNPLGGNGAPHRIPNGNGLDTPKHSGIGVRSPSPTASVASTAPTVDKDGWWS